MNRPLDFIGDFIKDDVRSKNQKGTKKILLFNSQLPNVSISMLNTSC